MAVAILETSDLVIISDADIDETAENDVAGGPCVLHDVWLTNDNAAAAYLKLYDNAAPTVGTTVPEEVIRTEGTGGASAGRIHVSINPPDGLEFETGLSMACVSTGGTGGTTTPTGTITVALGIERSE